MNIIEFNNVSKNIYKFDLGPINFVLKDGEILGIIGESGSGKTTILKLLLNFYKPKSGEINVFGFNSTEDSSEIKFDTGTMQQTNWFNENDRPIKVLKDTLRYRKLRDEGEISFLIDYFDANFHGKIKDLSALDKRKLAIINALVFKPRLILIDEPSSIPDPITRMKLYDILEEKNREGASIVIFSDNLKEAQSICDNIYYLNNGKIIEEEDQSNKLSNDKILRYFDKGVNKDIFTGIGAKLVKEDNETIFYYNKKLDLLSEAIYKAGLIDYSVEDSSLNDKLTILEKESIMINNNKKFNQKNISNDNDLEEKDNISHSEEENSNTIKIDDIEQFEKNLEEEDR